MYIAWNANEMKFFSHFHPASVMSLPSICCRVPLLHKTPLTPLFHGCCRRLSGGARNERMMREIEWRIHTDGHALWWVPFFPSVITLYLGVWQTQRYFEKQKEITRRMARLEEDPQTLQPNMLSELVTPDDLDKTNLQHRRVLVRGQYLQDQEVRVGPRSSKWGGNGFVVITPLRMSADKDTIVLVNRGWAPKARPLAKIEGDVDVSAVIVKPETPNSYTPLSVPSQGKWFFIDVPNLYKCLGKDPIPMVLEALESGPGGFPASRALDEHVTFPVMPSGHINYAVTWFTLSTLMCAMALKLLRRGH